MRAAVAFVFALCTLLAAASESWVLVCVCAFVCILLAVPGADIRTEEPPAPRLAPPRPVSPPPRPMPVRESPWEEYASWERAVVVEYLAGDINVLELESELEFYGEAYLVKTKPQMMRMKRKRRPC